MRILHLSKNLPPFQGGIESVCELMAAAGVALGAEVTVHGMGTRAGPHEWRGAGGVRYRSLPPAMRLGPITFPSQSYAVGELLAEATIVHVHMPNPLAEIAILNFLAKRSSAGVSPLIVPVVHADILRAPPLGILWGHLAQRPLIRRSTAVIAATRQLFDSSPIYRPFIDKLCALPFPVEALPLPALARESAPLQLLCIGRAAKYKGFDVLIKAMVGDNNWRLTIAGTSNEDSVLSALIAENNLGERVTLAGRVSHEDKCALLARSHIVVVPSITAAEAYGMTIVEAFAARKPVITTTIPTGMAFLARGGRCGATVPPADVTALRQAIAKLADDPQRQRAVGDENYRFWQSELTPELFNQRYAALVKNLLGTTPRLAASD